MSNELHGLLEAMLVNVKNTLEARDTPSFKENYQTFDNIVRDNPYVRDTLNTAAENGTLRKIQFTDPMRAKARADDGLSPLPEDMIGNAQAFYQSEHGLMRLRGDMLSNPVNLAGDIAHEGAHGAFALQHMAEEERFKDAVTAIAKSNDTIHDYTEVMKDYQQTYRQDEVRAEVVSWNASVYQMQIQKELDINSERTDSEVTQQINYKLLYEEHSSGGYYIEKIQKEEGEIEYYQPKEGISFSDDYTMDLEKSQAAVGEYYYDQAPDLTRAGPYSHSDYTNLYATQMIKIINELEQEHNANLDQTMITLDFNALKLDEKLLEENGLDLGQKEQTLTVYDISSLNGYERNDPSMVKEHALERTLDHTIDQPRHIENRPIHEQKQNGNHYGDDFGQGFSDNSSSKSTREFIHSDEYFLPDGAPLLLTGDKDYDDLMKAYCLGDREGMDAALDSYEQSPEGQEFRAWQEREYQAVLEERALAQQVEQVRLQEMERQQQEIEEQIRQQQLASRDQSGPSLERT